jgi:hypothetical protein
MDKNASANATQGATGQSKDVETHPAGTAERLRQLGVIGVRAAEIIEEVAQGLKDSESIGGEWPEEDIGGAHADYDEWTATAGFLRALCAPAETPAPEAKQAFPPPDEEDFTVPIYPWPADEDSQ